MSKSTTKAAVLCAEQLAYYHRAARRTRNWYVFITSIRILLTASIPLVAICFPDHSKPVLNGLLGSAILIVEAGNGKFSPGRLWIRYRAAYMALLSEKRLYDTKAGKYSEPQEADRILIERVNGVCESEHAAWQLIQEGMTEQREEKKINS